MERAAKQGNNGAWQAKHPALPNVLIKICVGVSTNFTGRASFDRARNVLIIFFGLANRCRGLFKLLLKLCQ